MRIIKYLVFSGLMLLVTALNSQTVSFTIDSKTAGQNEEVTLDITVEDFTAMNSIQFGIGWNLADLDFVSVGNYNTDIGINESNVIIPDSLDRDDRITFSWFEPSFDGADLDDGSVLFSITYEAIGDPGTVAPVSFVAFPRDIDVVQNEMVVDPGLNNGEVTIEEGNGGGTDLNFILPERQVDEGEQFCIPVVVENFDNIGSVTFGLFYNQDVLAFQNTGNYNLPNLDQNNFSDINGVITFSYNAPPEGATVSDGTAIFDICFEAIGSNGDMSDLFLDDVDRMGTVLDMEATDNDGNVLNIVVDEGKITIGEVSNEDFGFVIDPPLINSNDEFCVPVVVQGMEGITSAEFTLNWDEEFLQYEQIKNFLYMGSALNESNTDQGLVGVFWNSTTGQDMLYSEGDVFFEICFSVIDECEEGQQITWSEDVVSIEFSNADSEDVPTELIPGDFECEEYAVTADVTDVSCEGNCDGEIDLTISGWTVDTIIWSDDNLEPSANVTGVCAGTYSVTVSYTNGREVITDNIVVSENPPIEVSVDSIYAAVDGDNGQIFITASGGDGNYTYSYTPGDFNVEDPDQLAAGEYDLTVTDGNNCMTIVEDITVLDVNSSIQNTSCFDTEDGAISLDVSGGSDDFEYEWTCSDETSNSISDIPAGDCKVTITDIGNNFTNIAVLTVEAPDPIVINILDVDETNGNIDIDVTGGTGDYMYEWQPTGDTTQDLTGVEDGPYLVFVTDENGCTANSGVILLGEGDSTLITENTSNRVFNGFGVSCNGECDGFIELQVINVPDAEIEWSDGSEDFVRENLCTDTYSYTITNSEGEVLRENTIVLSEPDLLEFDEIDVECAIDNDGSVVASAIGGTGMYEYSLNGASYQEDNQFMDLEADSYTIYVIDENNCERSREFSIPECNDSDDCYNGIPVITPNGDGRNERLIISCTEDFDAQINIYTKWGEKVYEQDNYDNSWNGVDMSGEQLPEDTYLWVLIIDTGLGSQEIQKGSVTLLRSLN